VVTDSAIQLRGREDASTAFPLLWSRVPFLEDDYELEIRFRYGPPTAYGTTIGIGSAVYDGARYHQDEPAIPNIEDVLSIHQFAGGFWVKLWDEVLWQSLPPDTSWHVARVVREGATYSLFVDGSLLGSVTRTGVVPKSLYLGNPTVERFAGPWTALELDYVRITVCSTWGSERLRLPLVLR